jgi:hypothetical protein
VFCRPVLHLGAVLPAYQSPPRHQHLQAVLLALLCSVLFLRDALLPGRALVPYPPEQMDVVRAEAMANGTLDLQDARRGLASGGDKYLQSLCWDRVMQDRFRKGEFPLWTRDIAGGAPFVPQMAQAYEPINVLLWLLPSAQWYGWWYLIHQVLFGYFAYLFVRRLGCAHGSALFALVVGVLGLWTQCKVHHNVILTAALPLWPMLSAAFDLVHGNVAGKQRRRTIAWMAFWTGISWLSGFAVVSLQVSYLTVAFAGLLALHRARGERLRALLPVGVAMALGGLLSFAHMIPVLQASAVSARDSSWNPAFLAAHGLEWDHALSTIWPDLLSWPSDVFYPENGKPLADATHMPWSQLVLLAQPLSAVTGSPFQSWIETSFAVGIAPLACILLALFDRNRRTFAWFFAGTAVLAFAFATADEPFLSLARYVPGIASADLRRLLFTVSVSLVVLTGLGAESLRTKARRWPAMVLIVGSAAVSLLAMLWLSQHADEASFVRGTAELFVADHAHRDVMAIQGNADLAVAFVQQNAAPGEALHNLSALWTTAWRALLAASCAAIALFARRRWPIAIALLITATMLELLSCSFGPVQTVAAARITTPPKVVGPVFAAAEPNGVRPRLARLAARTDARIASWYPANLPGFHGLEDASGYNPLPSARYEQFFTAIEPDVAATPGAPAKSNVTFGGAGVGAFHDPRSLHHPLCDLFGIRFVVTKEDVPLDASLVDRTPPGTGGFRLLERTTTLPRATFVREVDVIKNQKERLAELSRPDRDVKNRIVLEDASAVRPAPRNAPPTEVSITTHTDERVVIQVNTLTDGYLRLADPYNAGWRATIDRNQTEVYVADHYLRAVYVKPGEHEIVFTFDNARVLWPRHLSLLALVAILWLATGLQRRRA